MAKKGLSIKMKISATLFLLPLISLLIVGTVALFLNSNALKRQAEKNLASIILEITRGYDHIIEGIQQEMEASAQYAFFVYRRDVSDVEVNRKVLMPWTGGGYGSEELGAAFYDERLRLEPIGQFLEVAVSGNPYLTLGYFATTSGIMVFDNEEVVDVFEELKAYDPRERPWYIAVNKERRLIWTEPYVDANTKKLTVTAAAPVYNFTGSFVGVIGFDVLLETLKEDILSIDLAYANYAFMINRNGHVLVSPEELGSTYVKWDMMYWTENLLLTENPELRAIIKKMIEGTPGIDLFKSGPRDRSYLIYAPIPSINSVVGIVIPEEEIVMTPVEASGRLLLIPLIAVIVIALGIGLILGNQITRPIQELTTMADKASRGFTEMKKIPVRRRDEIGLLAESFNRMVANMGIVLKELEGSAGSSEKQE